MRPLSNCVVASRILTTGQPGCLLGSRENWRLRPAIEPIRPDQRGAGRRRSTTLRTRSGPEFWRTTSKAPVSRCRAWADNPDPEEAAERMAEIMAEPGRRRRFRTMACDGIDCCTWSNHVESDDHRTDEVPARIVLNTRPALPVRPLRRLAKRTTGGLAKDLEAADCAGTWRVRGDRVRDSPFVGLPPPAFRHPRRRLRRAGAFRRL